MASTQIAKILQGKIWRFFGGIKPQELKNTSDCAIEELPLPSLITLPLERHLGEGGEILVKAGDHVKAGQPLTIPGGRRNVPLHASTSGTVMSIGMQVLPHPSGFTGLCVTIKPDGLDEEVDPAPIPNWKEKTPQELLERIRFFGIEGLGGAQFQTAAKLSSAIEGDRTCNIFIVNGCECEPVATCDDRLMQEKAEDIMQGIEIVKHILKPQVVIVAIEDNKPAAIKAMQTAAGDRAIIRVIPTLYPSGAARNLIKIVTGIEIPYKAHTSDCGIVVDNVETVFALKQAVIDGKPLIKRVITVAGESLKEQGNALVRLGTSVRFVLNHYHLNPERRQRIILGGPLMGFTVPSIDVPITKSATCVFAPSSEEVPLEDEAVNCIRCGRCARVCPSRLVPYQMYAYSKAGDHTRAKKCGISDCTECGCCAFVCPSRIRLTTQFRKEKAIQNLIWENEKRNERARERMTARQERLAREEAIRAEKKKAALARIQAQKQAAAAGGAAAPGAAGAGAGAAANLSPEELQKRRQAAIEAARLRAQQKKAGAAGNAAGAGTGAGAAAQLSPEELQKRRQAAIEAARLRAQQKRAAAQAGAAAEQTAAAGAEDAADAPEAGSVREQAAKVLAKDRVQRKAEAAQSAENLPYNLRRGTVPKKAAIVTEEWAEPAPAAPTGLKVENPPQHEIVVEEHKYHSIYSPAPEKAREYKLPPNLSKARKKD